MSVECEECGARVEIGQWPWCHGDASKHVKIDGFGFEPFEPYVDSNILERTDPRVRRGGYRDERGAPGILIETRSDRRQLMRSLGLQFGSRDSRPGSREI
jgi:hypothetical protein